MTAIISSRSATAWLRVGALALAVASLSLSGSAAARTPGKDADKDGEAVKLGKDGKPLPKVEAVPVEVAKACAPTDFRQLFRERPTWRRPAKRRWSPRPPA